MKRPPIILTSILMVSSFTAIGCNNNNNDLESLLTACYDHNDMKSCEEACIKFYSTGACLTAGKTERDKTDVFSPDNDLKSMLSACYDHNDMKSCEEACIKFDYTGACITAGKAESYKTDTHSSDYETGFFEEYNKKSLDKAYFLLKKACDHSEIGYECNNVILLYKNRLSRNKEVDKDLKDNAVKSWENDCNHNIAQGCYLLSIAYDWNLPSYINSYRDTGDYGKSKARVLCQKACDLNSAPACNDLGGLGKTPDELKYLQKACDLKFGMACETIANSSNISPAEKVKYLQKGCDYNFASSCEDLANTYDNGSPEKLKYLQKTCELNPRHKRCSEVDSLVKQVASKKSASPSGDSIPPTITATAPTANAAPVPAPTPAPAPEPVPTFTSLPDPYILAGPHFSLDEPWKISQFNEALIGKPCGFEDVTDASLIETTQGKTIKTEVGKIYYLEVEFSYSQRAFIGLRRIVDDKQIVTFYTVQPENSIDILLSSGGSVASTYTNHSLNDIYSATYDGKNFRIIEFNQIDWEERLCRDEEFTDENTGKLDTIAQKRCEASKTSMAQRKLAFAIDENGVVIGSGVVSEAKSTCKDSDMCSKKLGNIVKSIKDSTEFTLGNMLCVPNASATPNETPTINCRSKTGPAPKAAPTPSLDDNLDAQAKSIASQIAQNVMNEIRMEEGKSVGQFFSIKKALTPCQKKPASCEEKIAPLVEESFIKYKRGIAATILLLNNNKFDKQLFNKIETELKRNYDSFGKMKSIANNSPVGREIMNANFIDDDVKEQIFYIWYLRQYPYAGEDIWKNQYKPSYDWKEYLNMADNYID